MLALDANAKDRVLTALDALSIAPERFTPETNVYLGLRSIYWQLARAKNDDGLRDVVARLWSMAVHARGRQRLGDREGAAGGAGRVARGAGARRHPTKRSSG